MTSLKALAIINIIQHYLTQYIKEGRLNLLKAERLEKIIQMFNKDDVIKISEISSVLGVSEMTIRRDLKLLEEKGHVEYIHGGGKKTQKNLIRELSHGEKKSIMIEEKKHIAKIAASLIENGSTVFIGVGTTNEFIYDYIEAINVKIITNSITVFSKFLGDNRFELILIGGRIRSKTGAFVGSLANDLISKITFKLAFIGVNGIYKDSVTNSNEEEGELQRNILNNSVEKYILCDHSKFNKEDFYKFYNLRGVTGLITDDKIDRELKEEYEKYTKIIN